MSGVRLKIAVQIATSRRGVPHANSLRKWAAGAARQSGYRFAAGSVGLVLRVVGNAESRMLNRSWRGKDKPTNVLSFPYIEERTRHTGRAVRIDNLGDLILCAPVIAREARDQGKPLTAHWAHMIVHGVLHILGYDHVKSREAGRMETREVAILRGFGYQDPYLVIEDRRSAV
jgi:probable rRNA maturation factor